MGGSSINNPGGVPGASGGMLTQDAPMASIIDSTTTVGVVYFCSAVPGSATSAPVWSISRLTTATGRTQWADGTGEFTKVADNRASLTYA